MEKIDARTLKPKVQEQLQKQAIHLRQKGHSVEQICSDSRCELPHGLPLVAVVPARRGKGHPYPQAGPAGGGLPETDR